MLKFKRMICLILTIITINICFSSFTVRALDDVKVSTAISNIDRYNSLLTALEKVSTNSVEFKSRTHELKILSNLMMLTGYINTYNESVGSANATDTKDTTTNTDAYTKLFKDHINTVVTTMKAKNNYIKETYPDSDITINKSLFTNTALDVYLESMSDEKNQPLIHAKLLAEGLLVECDNRLRSVLSEISKAGESDGGAVLSSNKEMVKGTLQVYRDCYNNAKTLYGIGVPVFTSSILDQYNRSYIEIYSAFEEIAYKYGISLSIETLVSEDIVNINAADLIDLVASVDTGNENKLSVAYLALFAQSSSLMPFVSKINSINNAEYINSDIKQRLHRPFGNRRKPLYLMDVDDQVKDYLEKGGTPNKARIATLTDMVNDTDNIDIALFLKRDSEASSISSLGLEGNAELTKEQREKIETYRIPGLSKDFTEAVYLAKATSTKENNALQYMRANTNFVLLNNSIANYKNSKEIVADLTSPVYMDIYGNIVTESGYVVVPSTANATFYDQPMLPLNASLFLNYPVFGSSGSELIANRTEDKNKYILSIPTFYNMKQDSPYPFTMYKGADANNDYTSYSTQSVLDLSSINSNGAISKTKFKTMYIFPFTPYIWHKGIDDPYRVLDEPVSNIDVYYNGFFRTITPYLDVFDIGSEEKMKVIPITDKVIVNGEGAGYNLANLLTNEQVQEAIYQQNFHYLTSDQWSDKADGKSIGYSNGVLRDSLLLDIAQEVARGSDIGKVMVGDVNKTQLMQESIVSRGLAGILTASIAGFGEDIHRLFHTGAKNIVTYIPNISELPLMQSIVLNIVPIIVTSIIVIFFILIILTFISRKNSFKELVTKLFILVYIIFFIVAMCPIIITTGFNSITNITSTNIAYSILVEEENEDKGVSTLAFDSFSSDDKLNVSSPDIVHAKLSQESIQNQLDAAGIQLSTSQSKIQKFLFSDDRNFTSLDSNNIIYIRGNKLVTPIKDLYNSSRITFKQTSKEHPVANINIINYQLFQDWTNDPKPHYFMPYYMVLDNLIYNINEVVENTYTIPLIKKYQNEDKTTNLASTYFSCVLYTQPENYTKLNIELMDVATSKKSTKELTEEEKKSLKAYQETAMVTKEALGDTNDFLGLFNILQLPGTTVKAPFTGSNIDMEAVKRTDWFNNYYTSKLRTQFQTYSANNSKPIVYVNGYVTSDKNPALFTDSEVYVPLTFLDTVGFKHSVNDSNILSIWGNDIRLENKVGTDEYSINVETSTTKASKVLKGNPVVLDGGRLMFPISMLSYWEGNVNVASDRKSASVMLKDFNKEGLYGEIIEKVYNVNDDVRKFITSSKDYLTTVSDENILKTISLYSSIRFADTFSTSSHTLSPVSLSSGRVNYDTYLKSIFIPASELTSSDTISIYYYIAFKYPALVLFFALYQVVLLLFSITKVFALYGVILLFIFYAIRYFLFKSKSDPVIFKSIFVVIAYIYVSHALIFLGFKLTTSAINSNNSNFLSSFGASLILNIIILSASSVLLIYTLLSVKGNMSTLGYENLTGWMGNVVAFFKDNSRLKGLVGKITPNMLIHKSKLQPTDKLVKPSTRNTTHSSNVIDKNMDDESNQISARGKTDYKAINLEDSNIDISQNDNIILDNVKTGSTSDIKLGTGKVVSLDEFNKEVELNPELLKDNKYLKVGNKVVDFNNSLKASGDTKNIVRLNAPSTAKLDSTLNSMNIEHETHGGSVVALVNDSELAKVGATYTDSLKTNEYTNVSLVKVKGNISESNIKEAFKEKGITDYALYDKSIITTKENIDKVSDTIKASKLQLEDVQGIKAKDKESFVKIQKNISKKVLLNNNVLYSVETENIPKSTGKVYVKDAYSFEVNQLCTASAIEVLKKNDIKYVAKGKIITLVDTLLTDDLVNVLDKSLSIDSVKIDIAKGLNSVKNIIG